MTFRDGCRLFLLCALLTGFCLVLGRMVHPAETETAAAGIVIAEGNGIRVLSGAPDGYFDVTYTRSQLLKGTLPVVSPGHPLPEDFPVPNIRGVRKTVGAYLPALEETALARDAIQALCDLQYDHPLTQVFITRGALSMAQQNEERRKVFESLLYTCSVEEAAKKSREKEPAGGESEHQLGLCFDLLWTEGAELGKSDLIACCDTGLWLKENMWQYGFIRRGAPEHRAHEENVCGNLHIRYVGIPHAAAMQAGNWCLEEYLNILRTYGRITVKTDGQRDAYVYWQPMEQDESICVRLPSPYGDVSFDNMGGAVFTCMAPAV